MKTISKKMVLTALLALATLAPADMGAFSFSSLATLKNTTSSYLTPLYNYASTVCSRAWNWGTQKTVNLVAHAPFIGGTELSQKILWCADHPKIAASIFRNKMLNYRAKKQNKKILLGGALAPEKVVTVINSMLNELRRSDETQSKDTIACGPFSLTGTITKTATDSFKFQASLFEGKCEVGSAEFDVLLKEITEDGRSYECFTLTNSCIFSVKRKYQQRGFGEYFLSIVLQLLKSQKNSLGVIYPCPFKLPAGQENVDLQLVLEGYYKKFGFIKHPGSETDFVIAFSDGKINRVITFLKAIYANNTAAVKKLLDKGLNVNTTLDGISVAKAALESALHHKNISLLNVLLEYNALKDQNFANHLLELALEQKAFTIASLIIKKYPTCIDLLDKYNDTLLWKALHGNYGTETFDVFKFLLAHGADPRIKNRNRYSVANSLYISQDLQKLVADAIKKHQPNKLTDKIKE